MDRIIFTLFLLLPFFQNVAGQKMQIGLIVDEGVDSKTIKLAIKEIEGYFNANSRKIPNTIKLPKKFKRDTINAKALARYLQNEIHLLYFKNVYLTNKGICLSDNFTYSTRGFATVGGKLAVVSTLVVRHETSTQEEYESLMAKVLLHELAHLLGLRHCNSSDECMLVSSLPNPGKFYNAQKALCKSCVDQIGEKRIRKKHRNSKSR